jgi:dihydrofolate synthase / folylpolyglutamate synthase
MRPRDDSDRDNPDRLLEELSVPSRLGQRPGLERIRALLEFLGEPQRALRILHIGGTSGKGSTATIAAQIVRSAGYRVGLHVKPHLESVTERFVVDGVPISRPRLAGLLGQIATAARAMTPSWYELTVALALQYFKEEQVDVAVIEVGLGGTFDATNVVEPPVTILTNVGLDHTEVLGDTVELIAADKSGIVKPGQTLVCGVTQPGALAIVAERCRAVGATRWQAGSEIAWNIHQLGPFGAEFDLRVVDRAFPSLKLGLLGAHQVANASLATAATLALAPTGLQIGEDALREGLASVRVAGRLEVFGQRPPIVLDGAHNPDKMLALAQALDAVWPGRRVIGVLAFKRGHDLAATLAPLAGRLGQAIVTRFDATTDFGRGQSLDPASVEAALATVDQQTPVELEPDPIRAVQRALAVAEPDDLVCVTGSLYLVGEIRRWLRGNPRPSPE